MYGVIRILGLAISLSCTLSSLVGCDDFVKEIKEGQEKDKKASEKKEKEAKEKEDRTKISCYELDRRHEQCSEDYINGQRSGHHACLVMYERYLDCCVSKTHVCYDKD